MSLNDRGSAKIITISVLTILGAVSWYFSQEGKIAGAKKQIDETFIGMEQGYNRIKEDYVDGPVQVVNNITEDVKSQQSIIETVAKETDEKYVLPASTQNNNPITSNQTNQPKDEKLNELTSQMIENCKIITEEYNKIANKK